MKGQLNTDAVVGDRVRVIKKPSYCNGEFATVLEVNVYRDEPNWYLLEMREGFFTNKDDRTMWFKVDEIVKSEKVEPCGDCGRALDVTSDGELVNPDGSSHDRLYCQSGPTSGE